MCESWYDPFVCYSYRFKAIDKEKHTQFNKFQSTILLALLSWMNTAPALLSDRGVGPNTT